MVDRPVAFSVPTLDPPPPITSQKKKERKTDTFIHASNCIRTHDHIARPVKGTTRVGCRGHPCFSV
jgi:hypothetical protein